MSTANAKPRILGIVGATASAKTALSLSVAKELVCEIICMDSMQIYRHMNIGTAKPTDAERASVPHHMLDIVEPTEPFSVAQYVDQARAVISDILARGHVPMLVGGTGLYLQGLTLPMDYGGLPSDPALRQRLTAEAAQDGPEKTHARLAAIDPAAAARLHPNDQRRIIRALEIYELTGIPMSSHRVPTQADAPYAFSLYAIDWPRAELHARINLRVDHMISDGLVEEVKSLLANGVPESAQSMQGLGYKELLPYLHGETSLSKAADEVKTGTRNYARRQLIWFRRDSRIRWVASTDLGSAKEQIINDWKENCHEL